MADWTEYTAEEMLIKALCDIDKDLPGICPKQEDVFKAFKTLSPEKTRVMILGQDPYPQKGVATGIPFGNRPGTSPLSPSLEVIRECVLHPEKSSYRPSDEARFDVTMEHWLRQGVMMMNSSLTVKEGCPGSHVEAWRPFMEDLIGRFSGRREDVVWILLGKQALSLKGCIRNYAYLITTDHPAYNARNNTKMEDVFSEVNDFFKRNNLDPIEWLLPDSDVEPEDDLPF